MEEEIGHVLVSEIMYLFFCRPYEPSSSVLIRLLIEKGYF